MNPWQAARQVDLLTVMRAYGLEINQYARKISCPLPCHPDDSSPSFWFYPATNSFNCFGCKHGGSAIEFISLMDSVSKWDAVQRLLTQFDSDHGIAPSTTTDYHGRNKAVLDFSAMIRDFLHRNADDETAMAHAEKVCLMFDTITTRHTIDIDGMKSLLEKLRGKLNQ